MVDIVIGPSAPIGPPVYKPSAPTNTIEAEILNIRDPRKHVATPEEERRKQFRQDPTGARVLTILVPNGINLPKNLDGKNYKVLLRFMKK